MTETTEEFEITQEGLKRIEDAIVRRVCEILKLQKNLDCGPTFKESRRHK
jgi:hypothetical protein